MSFGKAQMVRGGASITSPRTLQAGLRPSMVDRHTSRHGTLQNHSYFPIFVRYAGQGGMELSKGTCAGYRTPVTLFGCCPQVSPVMCNSHHDALPYVNRTTLLADFGGISLPLSGCVVSERSLGTACSYFLFRLYVTKHTFDIELQLSAAATATSIRMSLV